MLKQLWRDQAGAVISPELAIVGAVLVIGLVVGLTALRVALDGEIRDIGAAVESVDFTPEITPVDPPPPGGGPPGGPPGTPPGLPPGPPFPVPPGPPPGVPPGPPPGTPPTL